MTGEVQTAIFVISMRDALERRAAFTDRAKNRGVRWSFFDGCTNLAPGLSYDEAEATLRWGRALTSGEVGCYSSHFSLWNQLLEDDADQYLILEDDVIVDWKFIERLVEVDFHGTGIDYLRLHCLWPGGIRVLKYGYFENKQLIQLRERAYGTQGYLLTRKGARRLAQYCRRIARPIDSQLDRYWEHGIPNLCLFPFPIVEEAGESLIDHKRRKWRKRPFRMRVEGKLHRMMDAAKRRAWLLRKSVEVRDLRHF